MNEENNPFKWQSLRKVERAEQKVEFWRAAQLCNEAKFYERAIDNALKVEDEESSEYALQIATEHSIGRVKEVYQKALKNCTTEEGKRKLAQIAGRKEDEEKAEATLMKKAEKLANQRSFSEAAKLYKTLGQKRKAAELYVKGTFNEEGKRINIWQLTYAAELYGELGEYNLAAEIYEEKGVPEKAEEFYMRAGNTGKAKKLYRERSHHHLEQVMKGDESELIWLVKDTLEHNYNSPIASEHLIEAINKTRDKQPIAKLFPETKSNEKNTTEVLEEICKNEDSKKKLIKIATSGTEVCTETRTLPGTDNFGESDTEETTYLDLELKETDPETIMTTSLYLIATDSKDLTHSQIEHMVANLHNIIKYRDIKRGKLYWRL